MKAPRIQPWQRPVRPGPLRRLRSAPFCTPETHPPKASFPTPGRAHVHGLPDRGCSRTAARVPPSSPPPPARSLLEHGCGGGRAQPQGRAGPAERGWAKLGVPKGHPPRLPRPPPHGPSHPPPAQKAGAAEGRGRPPQRHAPSSCPRPRASQRRPPPVRGEGEGPAQAGRGVGRRA